MIISITKESIKGVTFPLVCNCASMVIDTGTLSGRSKSQAIRYAAKLHKCNFALLTHSEKQEVYNFSPGAGISFSRQIEHFIETHADGAMLNDRFSLLIIPLDNRIYFADIEKGLVSNERTLVISAAKEELEKAQSGPVKIFLVDGGRSQAELDLDDIMPVPSFVISPQGLRNENSFYFERLLRLMTFRWRLFHPAQVVVLIAVALLFGGGILAGTNIVADSKNQLLVAVRQAAEMVRLTDLQAQSKIEQNATDYSAAVGLRSFLDYYRTVQLLRGSGLTQMTWDHQQGDLTEINVTGHTRHYPDSVIALGSTDQWNLQFNGFDWTLNSQHETSRDIRQISVDASLMRPLLNRLALTGSHKVALKIIHTEGGYELVDLSLDMPLGISALVDEIVPLLNNNPVSLERVVCRFEDWALLGCQAELKAKYRSTL